MQGGSLHCAVLVKFSCISADINIGALDGIMGESLEGALKKTGNTLSRISMDMGR